MKFLKIFVLLVAAWLFFPSTVFAKSGCCSGHGGVSCSAGPQANGNVVCNDGWRGSSCLYSEMIMCGGSSTTTTTYHSPAPIATPRPIYTPKPTIKPTVRPTETPSPSPTSTPKVQGVSTQASPTAKPEVLGERNLNISEALTSTALLLAVSYFSLKWLGKKAGSIN